MWLKKVKIAGSSEIKDKGIEMTEHKQFLTKVAKFYEVYISIGKKMVWIFCSVIPQSPLRALINSLTCSHPFLDISLEFQVSSTYNWPPLPQLCMHMFIKVPYINKCQCESSRFSCHPIQKQILDLISVMRNISLPGCFHPSPGKTHPNTITWHIH